MGGASSDFGGAAPDFGGGSPDLSGGVGLACWECDIYYEGREGREGVGGIPLEGLVDEDDPKGLEGLRRDEVNERRSGGGGSFTSLRYVQDD